MITSAITVVLVDRLGRKILLCAGCLIMSAALAVLAISFWGWDETAGVAVDGTGSDPKLVILCAMFIYIAGYQVGFGPITWCIVSEIFPLEVRGTAIALGVETNFALNFGVQFLFPMLQSTLGWGRTFAFFGVVLVFAFFYIAAHVPETTGLTLEEIQATMILEGSDSDGRRRDKEKAPNAESPTEETNLLSV